MAELKTKQTKSSVEQFLNKVADEKRRKDCAALIKLMKRVTKQPPKMWGSSIVGFGSYHYKYASGHEGDTCMIGFSPRKDALTLYLMLGGLDRLAPLLKRLGKHKTGKGCLYIKTLDDVDLKVLEEIIRKSFASAGH
jgi:hypothetical protein